MRFVGPAVIIAAILMAMLAIILLNDEVARELRRLQTASSDNVQWTLSQAEVEFLQFEKVVANARLSDGATLEDVRLRFDVFYSRIATLAEGHEYIDLASIPEAEGSLDRISRWLEQTVPMIDAGDEALLADLDALAARAEAIEPELRTLATAGLQHFAAVTQSHRDGVSSTLTTLAIVTTVLISVLLLLALYFNQISQQNIRRRREIQQTSARMETVINTALDAVVVTDKTGAILEFNEAAERIFGHARDIALSADIGALIVPDHLRASHAAGMKRALEGGERRVVGKGRVRIEGLRASGEIFPVEMSIQSAVRDGEEIFVAFLRDISAQVKAERDLVEARDRALAGERAKANFLAVMSHEIRTPLNGLLGNLTLLTDTALTPEQSDYARRMDMSGRLLMNHVNDVLDIAKSEAGKLELLKEPVNVDVMLMDLVAAQASDARANGTTLDWRWVGAPQSWICSDRARLEQLMLNLVGNAIKFTVGGRITIEAEVLSRNGADIVLEFRVSDTGIGIAETDIDRIFGDFETLDSSFGRKVGGTGLGLGIARRISAAAGGEIGVESVVGEGSTFWVRLPVATTQAPVAHDAPAVTPAVTHQSVSPRKILIVEDNEINRHVVREMLQRDGHTTVEATDGQQAVDIAMETEFDLILMDISMPVMDGRQATQVIRAGNGASADRPIVAFTANVLAGDIDIFRQDGMDATLSKPVSVDALREIVMRFGSGRGGRSVEETRPEAPVMKLDQARIDETRSLIGDDIFAKFLGRLETEMDDLVSWFDAAPDLDVEEIAARCHKLASSAGTYGATDLRQALIAAEHAAKSVDEGADLQAPIRHVKDTWAETRPRLRELM